MLSSVLVSSLESAVQSQVQPEGAVQWSRAAHPGWDKFLLAAGGARTHQGVSGRGTRSSGLLAGLAMGNGSVLGVGIRTSRRSTVV